jgi:hypothetical protein
MGAEIVAIWPDTRAAAMRNIGFSAVVKDDAYRLVC